MRRLQLYIARHAAASRRTAALHSACERQTVNQHSADAYHAAVEMHAADWATVAVLAAVVALANVRAMRHNRSVADFVAANRSAGPYLLATADGTAGLGAVSIVANLERFFVAGFAPRFWLLLGTPIAMVITLSGFVRWRFRATRSLTMCQFFELRYGSRRLRIVAGGLCWFSGVVNMGIFPGVGTRFFLNFCDLPEQLELGGVELPTFPLLMALLLAVSLSLTVSGGQIAVIVTDFAQGVFCALVFLALCAYLALRFGWGQAAAALEAASAPGNSLFDPFDIAEAGSFNAFYYASTLYMLVYNTMSWQVRDTCDF